jgi:hypothetical protein
MKKAASSFHSRPPPHDRETNLAARRRHPRVAHQHAPSLPMSAPQRQDRRCAAVAVFRFTRQRRVCGVISVCFPVTVRWQSPERPTGSRNPRTHPAFPGRAGLFVIASLHHRSYPRQAALQAMPCNHAMTQRRCRRQRTAQGVVSPRRACVGRCDRRKLAALRCVRRWSGPMRARRSGARAVFQGFRRPLGDARDDEPHLFPLLLGLLQQRRHVGPQLCERLLLVRR